MFTGGFIEKTFDSAPPTKTELPETLNLNVTKVPGVWTLEANTGFIVPRPAGLLIRIGGTLS